MVTLARLATEFLERPGLSQSTRRSYEAVLMPLLALYGRVPVEIINRQVISDYLQSLEHLSINTHHRHQAIIQSLFNYVHATWCDLTAQSSVLKGVRLHDLRHTFATERVGLMFIEELRALMGHEKIQTTLRYQKVTSQRAEEVAQKALKALTFVESEISNEI